MAEPVSKKLKTSDAEGDINVVAADVKAIKDEFAHVANDKPLWLEIVRFLDWDMLNNVIDDMPEFRGMRRLVRAERCTAHLLEEIGEEKRKLESDDPEVKHYACERGLCHLEFENVHQNNSRKTNYSICKENFLYEWGADKAGFGSKGNFAEFCKHAGVDPFKGRIEVTERHRDKNYCYHYLSDDKKVIFTCAGDPARSDNTEAYVHYFGMTGSRDRVKWLYSWFLDNCVWDGMCSGVRDFT